MGSVEGDFLKTKKKKQKMTSSSGDVQGEFFPMARLSPAKTHMTQNNPKSL
jgi:hypothetical protein